MAEIHEEAVWRVPYTARQIEDSIGKEAIIGENGNWQRWDITTGDYEDTGKPARGPKGETGPRGETGPQGDPGQDATVNGQNVLTITAERGVELKQKQDVLTIGTPTWPSNPNLLDNWYFIDPINQRGLTEYTGDIYTIDRWRINAYAGEVTVQATDGITFALTNQTRNNAILQRFEDGRLLGKTVTFSVLADLTGIKYDFALTGLDSSYVHNFIYKRFSPEKSGVQLLTVTATLPENGCHGVGVYLYASSNGLSSIKLIAAKLELGDTQTLAHQDADGNWVLNDPPPNKAVELAKCQRYFQRINAIRYNWIFYHAVVRDSTKIALIDIPISPMRDRPVCAFAADETIDIITKPGGSSISGVNRKPIQAVLEIDYGRDHFISIQLNFENSGTGGATGLALIGDTGNGYIDLSADL